MTAMYTRLGATWTTTKQFTSSPGIGKVWHVAAFAMVVLVLTIGTSAVTSTLMINKSVRSSSVRTQNCGNSSEEARSQGCYFDVISFTWSQPSCFDKTLMENFLSLQNWTWFRNPEDIPGIPVPFDEVSAGRHSSLYVTWEYHITHCTFMWKKMHRAIMTGRPLDSYVNNIKHTEHCEEILLDREISLQDRHTTISIKFPDCPILVEQALGNFDHTDRQKKLQQIPPKVLV